MWELPAFREIGSCRLDIIRELESVDDIEKRRSSIWSFHCGDFGKARRSHQRRQKGKIIEKEEARLRGSGDCSRAGVGWSGVEGFGGTQGQEGGGYPVGRRERGTQE